MWSPSEGLPPATYFQAAYPGFTRPGAKLGTRVRAARHPCRNAARRRWPRGSGCPSRWRSRSATSTRSSRSPAPGSRAPGTFVTVSGPRSATWCVDTDEVRLPGITGVVKTGSCPGCTATRPDRRPSATCSRGSSSMLAARPRPTFAALEQAAAQFGPGETGLVALDWWNGNRSILADAGLSGAIFGLTLQSDARADLPGAARVDRVRQPADHRQLHRARAGARRDRRLRRDRASEARC